MAQSKDDTVKPSGLFGRLFGTKGKSPIKAKLGQKNEFYYNEKLKRWVMPGAENEASAATLAPPPMSRNASSASMSEAEGGQQAPGHRRTTSSDSAKRVNARYADPGLIGGKAGASSEASSTSLASLVPMPAKPPLVPTGGRQASVFVPGNAEGAAAATQGPRFFVPGTAAASQGASSRFAGFSTRKLSTPQAVGDGGATSPSQGPEEGMGSDLTLAKGLGNAPEEGALDASGLVLGGGQSAMHPGGSAAAESVGENTLMRSNDPDLEGAITSPGPRALGMDGAADADLDAEAGVVTYQEGGGFDLGSGHEQPDQSADDGWGFGGAADAAWLSQHDEGQSTAEQPVEDAPAVEVTWELIQQWAEYYRSQGSTEEELRSWIATTYPTYAHHLADVPANEGAFDWGQQQQQQQLDNEGIQVDRDAGQTVDGSQSNQKAAVHPADDALATAKTSESEPGPDVAGQPEPAYPAEAPRVQFSTGDELPQSDHSTQGVGRPQNEVQSMAAEYGSSRGHMDDVSSIGTVAQESGQEHESQPGGAFEGARGSEGTASGKLTGPLPWDVLGDHSDDENSTAGTPRFELTMSNGQPVLVETGGPGGAARPALAGAALAEAAEHAGGRIAGWVTGLVRSGALQSAAAAQLPGVAITRFPRAPLDARNAAQQSPRSTRPLGTSTRAQPGTPVSAKPVAQEGAQVTKSISQPPSAKATNDPNCMQQAPGAAAEKAGHAKGARASPIDEQSEDANGWSFEGSDLPGVAGSHPEHRAADNAVPERQQEAGVSAGPDDGTPSRLEYSQPFSVLASVSTQLVQQQTWPAQGPRQEGAKDGSVASRSKGSTPKSLLSPKTALPAPQEAPAFASDRSIQIPAVPEEVNVLLVSEAQSTSAAGAPAARESGAAKVAHELVPANGNGGLQLYGDSPRSGWEGADSELGFPLDDIPREHAATTHRAPGAVDLPEGAGLAPLVVPSKSPLRHDHASTPPDSSAAVAEAFAHGNEAAQVAALQQRLQEVMMAHRQALDDCEALRDQNGALEMELGDVKGRVDEDVLEVRALQEELASKAKLEEQLEELWQEAEHLRSRNDALAADNATLRAERGASDAPPAKPPQLGLAAENGDAADDGNAAAALQDAQRHILDLQEELEAARADSGAGGQAEAGEKVAQLEARCAALEEQATELMAEAEALAEEGLAKDEEIEALEGKLSHALRQAGASSTQASTDFYAQGLSQEEADALRKEAAAVNQEVVLLGDALAAKEEELGAAQAQMAQLSEQLKAATAEAARASDALSSRSAGEASVQAELHALQAELQKRDAQIVQTQHDLASQVTAVDRLRLEVGAKDAAAGELRAALESARKAAAQEAARLGEQLEQQAAQMQQLQSRLSLASSGASASEEARAAAEAALARAKEELSMMREQQVLDFERIGSLAEENASLTERVEELEASSGAGLAPSQEALTELEEARAALSAAQASAAEAEARAQAADLGLETAKARAAELEGLCKSISQEKDVQARRCAKMQARMKHAATESQEKQGQLTAELQAARRAAEEAQSRIHALEQEQRMLLERLADAAKAHASEKAQVSQALAHQEAQVSQLQAALDAKSQQSQEAQRQLAAADAQLADARKERAALSEELSAEKSRAAELEEEASAQYERAVAAEEEAGLAEARSHATAKQLEDARAQLQALQAAQLQAEASTPLAGPGADDEAAEEVARLQAEADEQRQEFGDLLACLGQESAKVSTLQQLLAEQGIDASALLAQVEADFGVDEEEEEEEEKEGDKGAAEENEEIGLRTEQPLEAAEVDVPHAGQLEQAAGSPGVEGLPEGELLSPAKEEEPSAQQAEAAKRIAASIGYGDSGACAGAAAPQRAAEFDGWDADDGEGDWSIS